MGIRGPQEEMAGLVGRERPREATRLSRPWDKGGTEAELSPSGSLAALHQAPAGVGWGKRRAPSGSSPGVGGATMLGTWDVSSLLWAPSALGTECPCPGEVPGIVREHPEHGVRRPKLQPGSASHLGASHSLSLSLGFPLCQMGGWD